MMLNTQSIDITAIWLPDDVYHLKAGSYLCRRNVWVNAYRFCASPVATVPCPCPQVVEVILPNAHSYLAVTQ